MKKHEMYFVQDPPDLADLLEEITDCMLTAKEAIEDALPKAKGEMREILRQEYERLGRSRLRIVSNS